MKTTIHAAIEKVIAIAVSLVTHVCIYPFVCIVVYFLLIYF